MEYDEQKAIQYINRALENAGRKAYDDDEILNVIDIIWDFYEENGMLDIDADDDNDADIKTIAAHVAKMLSRDKLSQIESADINTIVEAEINYEQTLDI